jgi:hypothetical protein
VVVGGQDTGYQWDHPALKNQYRGWSGSSANHNYNWHDAIHSGGGSCGANSPYPCDDYGHGTHTMGTMVGDDGGSNQIGVAPSARWIGCRNMDQGNGTPATYSECFQWFIAPTDLNGQNPDPSKAPDVINNSWGCPASEGCTDPNALKTVVENARAAGIEVVASAGNSGSGCSSVSDPPAIYAAAFSVGATDSSDTIASYSSRGPVTADGSNRMKPEVSAPGVSIRSSTFDGGYGIKGGTSMAGPHVAGWMALMMSARPDWVGQLTLLETLAERSAVPRTIGTQTCGGVPGTQVPNNTYGWGRVDALAGLNSDADGDGTSNLNDCSPLDAAVWAIPSEARNLRLSKGPTTATFTWSAPTTPGCQVPQYDLIRSVSPNGFPAGTCVASGLTGLSTTDAAAPGPGSVFFYLVRAKDPCGGNLGTDSTGHPRTGIACP